MTPLEEAERAMGGSDHVECPHCQATSIYSEQQLQNHIRFFHQDETLGGY